MSSKSICVAVWMCMATIGSSNGAVAQVGVGPRLISYQGTVQIGGVPLTGTHKVTINYYNSSGLLIGSETDDADFKLGVFNYVLGHKFTGGMFPPSFSFTQELFIGVAIDNGVELAPRSPMLSAPFALNASAVNGIFASPVPDSGKLFPLPIMGGRIAPSILPNFVATLNHIGPDGNTGDIEIVGSGGITVTNNSPTHTITIAGSGGSGGGGISTIVAGPGISATNSNGPTTTLSVDPSTVHYAKIAGVHILTAAEQGLNSIQIQDNAVLIANVSTVIANAEADVNGSGVPGVTSIYVPPSGGSFWVNTSAASFAGVTRIHYLVMNP